MMMRIVRPIMLAPEQTHTEPLHGGPRLRECRWARAAIDRADRAGEATGGA